MAKLMFPMVVLALAGCASIGKWRELHIDGSTQAAFEKSLSTLDSELPYSRRQMFQLALVDIVRTEVESAGQGSEDSSDGYTDEDYRRQLNGLTYDGVIALADQTGPSIWSLYYSGAQQRDPWKGIPWPQTDPYRFPARPVVPPGMSMSSP